MSAERPGLTDLAASVADGAPIDWRTAEGGVDDPRERRLVRQLRLVSSVAELYRSLPSDAQPADAAAAEPEGPRWGHLVLLDSIGRGTSAEVHRAWDLELHRDVALKLFPADTQAGPRKHAHVLSEARRLARVRHPNVAAVYGADRDGDQVGFWMELVRGTSLQDLLDRDGPFGAREVAVIGSELCAALAAVHGAGLLHRDIKAQNVLREQGGRIVLTDFGTGDDVGAAPRGMAGTPMYLAPEVLAGGEASVASDIYSLGVLLFLLASGSFPIAAGTMKELVGAQADGRRRRLRDLRPDVPAGLAGVIETALSADPSARFPSAGALDEALRRTLDRPAAPSSEPSATPRAGTVRRWLRPAALVPALGLVAVALVWVGWWYRTSPASLVGGVGRVDSLAVLPIADLSGQAPQLADALTDQLIASLGRIHALRVTSRTSVLPFGGGGRSATEAARSLGVRAVLEASVALGDATGPAPRPVRVNARLLAADTGAEIWGGTFHGVLGDTLALQASIARAIARSIQVKLSPAEAERLDRRQQTSPAAEEAYFQGRSDLNRFGIEGARRAVEAFERASTLDPNYAPPLAGLAHAYVTLGFGGALSQPAARARALAAAERALDLDPDSVEAETAIADLKFYYDWDWKGAEAAYTRAIDLRPSWAYARTQYAQYLAAAGRLPDALDQAAQAAALDPLSALVALTEGLVKYYARDSPGAEEAVQRALRIDSRSARAYLVLGRVRESEGNMVEALAATERAMALSPQPFAVWRANLIRQQALAGHPERALAELRALMREPQPPPPEHLAYVWLALGDRDRAMGLLEQAARAREPGLLWLAVDPRVDPLRGLPRFDALVEQLERPSRP